MLPSQVRNSLTTVMVHHITRITKRRIVRNLPKIKHQIKIWINQEIMIALDIITNTNLHHII